MHYVARVEVPHLDQQKHQVQDPALAVKKRCEIATYIQIPINMACHANSKVHEPHTLDD